MDNKIHYNNSSFNNDIKYQYQIGDRIQVSGEIATVKFVGQLPSGSSDAWIGLEWDNTDRGKHSGEFQGTRYFTTRCVEKDIILVLSNLIYKRNEGAGSFIKISSKISKKRGFWQALIDKYAPDGDDHVHDVEYFGDSGVKVEMFGFEKLSKKLK